MHHTGYYTGDIPMGFSSVGSFRMRPFLSTCCFLHTFVRTWYTCIEHGYLQSQKPLDSSAWRRSKMTSAFQLHQTGHTSNCLKTSQDQDMVTLKDEDTFACFNKWEQAAWTLATCQLGRRKCTKLLAATVHDLLNKKVIQALRSHAFPPYFDISHLHHL